MLPTLHYGYTFSWLNYSGSLPRPFITRVVTLSMLLVSVDGPGIRKQAYGEPS